MEYVFNSKIYTGESKSNIWFKIVLIIVGGIIVVSILIKLLMRDFNPSDLKAVLFALIIIGCSKINVGSKAMYMDTIGKIQFDLDGLHIIYEDIWSSKNSERYDEDTFIRYSDIREIDLSRDLDCFRIVGDAERRRMYKSTGKELIEENPDEDSETFIYVEDDEQQNELKDILQKRAKFIIKEMEEQE